jgi:hypothetical protein
MRKNFGLISSAIRLPIIGPNMVPLREFESPLRTLTAVDALAKARS